MKTSMKKLMAVAAVAVAMAGVGTAYANCVIVDTDGVKAKVCVPSLPIKLPF